MSTSVADWGAFRRAGEAGRLNVRLMAYIGAAQAAEANMRPTPWLYDDRLRAVGVIQALEERLRRPVLTANQVTFWAALKTVGSASQVTQFGRLFKAAQR